MFNEFASNGAPAGGWRCVLVGAEALLVDCAQQLEARGASIVAVVSAAPAVAGWAAERGAVFADAAALMAAADELGPIDYLFSITNLTVLPDDVLALPTRAAINFHDGPLPERAGVNTPAWALLDGATEHGVTWHLMTAEVDGGAILGERRFPIAADETALSLNRKCFAAASESFGELLDRLAALGVAPLLAASTPLSVRRKADRPAAGGAIRWDRAAGDIVRLVRALDFGGYANPMCAATARIGTGLLIVQEASLAAGSGEPGTILRLERDGIVVAAGDGAVAITKITALDGATLDPLTAATRFGLAAGGRLPSLDDEHEATLLALAEAAARYEGFWTARLLAARAPDLPGVDRMLRSAGRVLAVDQALPASDDPARAEALIAAALGWMARITDADTMDLGYAGPVLRAQFDGVATWFAAQAPLHAELDFGAPFAALRDAVADDIRQIHRRIGVAADLAARHPALRTTRGAHPLVLPVALTVVDDLDEACAEAGAELTLAFLADGSACRWLYDADRLASAAVAAMQGQFATLLAAADADPATPLGDLPLMDDAARDDLMLGRNATATDPRADACVHTLIEEQVRRTPDAVAVICGERSMTYAELDHAADLRAKDLRARGVGPDTLVGLYCERSLDLVVGVLAVHKAGGAYVPLDPEYPAARIEHMLSDSGVAVVLTQRNLIDRLPRTAAALVCLDAPFEAGDAPLEGGASPQNLAYVIYTSGSTGTPKGVMVEHRNVVNFFAGMDQRIEAPGTWLAVTSLSFDISVLELCWTLTRGFTVVLYTAEDRRVGGSAVSAQAGKPLDFSLFYFASDAGEAAGNKYKLLMEGAKFADREGFSAIWTPERHFHAFGGLYPNPAVTSAAVAAITTRVRIRAGSVVLPLHHPIRVAEDWSLVDNLSDGRAEISFAAGWQPNDFVLAPDKFKDAKAVMLRDMEVVRKLWRGESVAFPGPLGKDVETTILPRPVQPELPFWLTSAGNVETFEAAGRAGANVLTHLLGQTIDELEAKLGAYRAAWRAAGHPGEGRAAVMLHSFVGPDAAAVRATVRGPLIEYLRTSASLIKQYAWSFPAFKRRAGMESSGDVALDSLDKEEMDALLEYSFERYFETSGLFGTPADCMAVVDRLKAVGADEVACLIDFGIDSATVLAHLPYLNEVRRMAEPVAGAVAAPEDVPALMARHGVTHLQCTPSMASLLLADGRLDAGLANLRHMMVGGEALPPALARELKGKLGGRLSNMYGPTETTIWSTMAEVGDGPVTLGTPLANQEVFILDRRQRPVPAGVPGELVIGGAGVTRGYFQRPELTAGRFVAHPLRAGERVYRTGDLARFATDGSLEFLGRLDTQVKIRGHRIELGEIEAALSGHPAVREAAVLAREDTPGDVRLVAYVVPNGVKAADEALLAHLRERLSEAMLPGRIVTLAAMPRTPNGKLDRRALPQPTAQVVAIADAAPAGEGVEAEIAAVWRDVLKLPSVGLNDNFFDIGGHSLLAVQAHRALCAALGRKLSITDMFRYPTVKALAAFLGEAGGDTRAVEAGTNRADARRAAMGRRRAPSLTGVA